MMFDLYHYFEKNIGPFKNLSDLSIEEAQVILNEIKESNITFAAQRYDGYLKRRFELEQIARKIFIKKGGKPIRDTPHYMVVESCEWLKSWYKDGDFIKLSVKEFDPKIISFSYGDLFPTFSDRINDGKEYRKQVYTFIEIIKIIEKYDLPQKWNRNGEFGPERYIEVQVWSNEPIKEYIK